MSDFGDFDSPDPLVRYNAHQAAKGRTQIHDPDLGRKRDRENAPARRLKPGRRSRLVSWLRNKDA